MFFLRQIHGTVLSVSTRHEQVLVISIVRTRVVGHVHHWCVIAINLCFDNMRICQASEYYGPERRPLCLSHTGH